MAEKCKGIIEGIELPIPERRWCAVGNCVIENGTSQTSALFGRGCVHTEQLTHSLFKFLDGCTPWRVNFRALSGVVHYERMVEVHNRRIHEHTFLPPFRWCIQAFELCSPYVSASFSGQYLPFCILLLPNRFCMFAIDRHLPLTLDFSCVRNTHVPSPAIYLNTQA